MKVVRIENFFIFFVLQVYRTLRDAVVLDWTISLADKDKMKTCAVTYLAKEANESTTIDPFMPRTRTFLLEHLLTGQVSSFLDASISNARGAVGGERKISRNFVKMSNDPNNFILKIFPQKFRVINSHQRKIEN